MKKGIKEAKKGKKGQRVANKNLQNKKSGVLRGGTDRVTKTVKKQEASLAFIRAAMLNPKENQGKREGRSGSTVVPVGASGEALDLTTSESLVEYGREEKGEVQGPRLLRLRT